MKKVNLVIKILIYTMLATISVLAQADSVDVTFRWNTTGHSGYSVPGEFNGWNNTAAPMSYQGNDLWVRTERLPVGGNPSPSAGVEGAYQYKFYYSGVGNWPNDPLNHHVNTSDNSNTFLYIKDPTIYHLVPNQRSGVVNNTLPTISAFIYPKVGSVVDTSALSIWIDGTEYSNIGSNYNFATKQLIFSVETPLENGSHNLILDTGTNADTVTFTVLLDPVVVEEPVPDGITPGINYVDDNTVTLCLFAPYKEFVFVIGDFNNWSVNDNYLMKRETVTADSVFYWLTIEDLSAGEEYAFQYFIDGETKIADPYTQKILDPWNDQYISESTYPGLKPYPQGLTSEATAIMQTAQEEFTWINSDTYQRPSQEKLVIYELLIRDFLEAHDYSTLIDTLSYFETLGVNAIELMPINEFEGNTSWGYNPSFYFAPDKYYGPEEDLKRFIDECHGRGIAVIIDMVLNHSYGQSPLVRMYWDSENNRPSAQNPWYNVTSPNPVYSWGYDFDHESDATKAFIDRVNAFWLTEFKVDGFRFDFTKGFTNTSGEGGGYDAARINILKRMADEIWAVEDDAYIILEHFADNNEEIVLSNYGMMIWGNLNYSYSEATMGWNATSDFSWGYYSNRSWSQPNLVTYMESHDEERLMAKNMHYGNSSGDYDIQDLETSLGRLELAGAFFFTYPGPKMIWQFGEMGYDFWINYPGEIGEDDHRVDEKPIRWDYMEDLNREKLYKTWAALIKLRNENEVFTSHQTSVNMWVDDADGRKRIKLTHSSMNVSIIGNFGVVDRTVDVEPVHPGHWYDYISGDSINYISGGYEVNLAPGEFRIFTDHKLETPILTGINDHIENITHSYRLLQNYPNPFNPETNITFEIPKMQKVEIAVYNVLGQKIRVLANETFNMGMHTLKWNGQDEAGQNVSSGIYILYISSGDFVQSKKMVLVR